LLTNHNEPNPFVTDISYHIWDSKYRWRDGDTVIDHTIQNTWQRVANALASVEPRNQTEWQSRFYQVLDGFKFLPAGRILAGAGTQHRVTLFNCFVMGVVEDSMDGIFDGLKEGALTMQQGGGVGYDFSTLRPKGTLAHATGGIASGPVSFMRIWNTMCSTLLSTGARRGAMMATMRCDHPDIEEFINAKQSSSELNHFNLSVQVFDEFMDAVRRDDEWALVFPAADLNTNGGSDSEVSEILMKRWSGATDPIACRVIKKVKAKELWNKIVRATYDYAEPGVLFIDRINEMNNLWYCEHISATNPCGEIPLPPYGACDLGSINLTRFVTKPFTNDAKLDIERIVETTQMAVRMLDNVIDISGYPLTKQADVQNQTRRIGLGITGLANALLMLGLHYGEADSRETAAKIMKTICDTAYRASIELAKEKGPFLRFDSEKYMQSRFIQSLSQDIRDGIAKHGIRNSHLTAIAPTGTISLLANNISSGLEPIYDESVKRRVLELDGSYKEYTITDNACRLWQELNKNQSLPNQFITAEQLSPKAHLAMQAALQPYVDNSISKTINIPEDYPFDSFAEVYDLAYESGLKGCTTFRPTHDRESILKMSHAEKAPHCCNLEREAD